VKIAVEEGRLREGRYRSYVRILDSLKEDQGRGR
jgi:putative ribosome biogenesis GTPase RsgA